MIKILEKKVFVKRLRKITENYLSSKDCATVFDSLFMLGVDTSTVLIAVQLYRDYLKRCTLTSTEFASKERHSLLGEICFGDKNTPAVINNLLPSAVLIEEKSKVGQRQQVYIYISPFSEKTK
jgi:hypothetical protein